MIAKALWHIDESNTTIIEEEILETEQKNVLINTKYSFISSGTETLVSRGLVPNELKDKMTVNYMGGSFNFPVKYGYSLVGETGDGRNVHLMHPHQDRLYAKESDLYIIPAGLPLKRAALLSNMETTINAVWDAQLKGDEKVLVIGFGGVGALLALTISRYTNINPCVMEPDKDKMKKAQGLGFSFVAGEYDVIFHTSASNDGLQYAIDHVRKDGVVMELSWYGNRQVNLSLGGNFHYNRVKLISSQVSVVSPFAPIKSFKERKDAACTILLDNVFDEMITNEIGFNDLPAYFDDLKINGNKPALATIVKYI
jgi:threonine dehydrogenase-like Zn-dependent dehydrogenase